MDEYTNVNLWNEAYIADNPIPCCTRDVKIPPKLPPPALSKVRTIIDALLTLCKAKQVVMSLATTVTGYLLAVKGYSIFSLYMQPGVLLLLLLGASVSMAGAAALNQALEVERDGLMWRTRNRPLPIGIFPRRLVVIGAIGFIVAGSALLGFAINPLTGVLSLAGASLYTVVYTPLKFRSSLCTIIGAVCGSVPPVMGWSAAGRGIGSEALSLGLILFVWQIPHFLALSALHRREYGAAGLCMLPVIDKSGRTTCRMVLLYLLTLGPVSLTPVVVGLAGWLYAAGALLAGLYFTAMGVWMYVERSEVSAKRLYQASIVYLPVILMLMLI